MNIRGLGKGLACREAIEAVTYSAFVLRIFKDGILIKNI